MESFGVKIDVQRYDFKHQVNFNVLSFLEREIGKAGVAGSKSAYRYEWRYLRKWRNPRIEDRDL